MPQTQGEQLVKRPAAYMRGRDAKRLLGLAFSSTDVAKLLAADSAWYTTVASVSPQGSMWWCRLVGDVVVVLLLLLQLGYADDDDDDDCEKVAVVVGGRKALAGRAVLTRSTSSCSHRTSWRRRI